MLKCFFLLSHFFHLLPIQDFITAIPRSKWQEGLLLPAEQCTSNGYTCIQTAYPDPTESVKIEVEDRSTGGDRAPYYIMDRRARLKHIKIGQVRICYGKKEREVNTQV